MHGTRAASTGEQSGGRNHDGAFANFVRTSDAAAMFRGMVEILSSRRGVLTTSDEFGKQTAS